ncbi:hypothetical protein Pla86_03680 [Planctomycetes bacterium Pla86]|uniref:Uncharacterized protein n=1 Tax=Engelhardtia mirabilis TaxID=2528011 RepID=A0A518BEJ3_9BACT|nr:hypothetical protein Pla133_03680 [Planctomycetes bacterium Pla133]QDU99629.1 hypothetical protein Pla86_03680 [Planctomycetes bacterium Pla86]
MAVTGDKDRHYHWAEVHRRHWLTTARRAPFAEDRAAELVERCLARGREVADAVAVELPHRLPGHRRGADPRKAARRTRPEAIGVVGMIRSAARAQALQPSPGTAAPRSLPVRRCPGITSLTCWVEWSPRLDPAPGSNTSPKRPDRPTRTSCNFVDESAGRVDNRQRLSFSAVHRYRRDPSISHDVAPSVRSIRSCCAGIPADYRRVVGLGARTAECGRSAGSSGGARFASPAGGDGGAAPDDLLPARSGTGLSARLLTHRDRRGGDERRHAAGRDPRRLVPRAHRRGHG